MGKRGKTDESYNVPLLEIPKTILEKYKNTLPNSHLLPVINNQNTNLYLKEVGELCGIKKKLTFHLSRAQLTILDTRMQVFKQCEYFCIATTCDSFQVLRFFLLTTMQKIGKILLFHFGNRASVDCSRR
jgi:hypothetical protein